MFCKDCGTQNPDDAKYCSSCGERLTSPLGEQITQSPTPTKEVKSNYNKWISAFGFIFGALSLSGSLSSGWPYYFQSGIQLVLICEVFITLMSIFLTCKNRSTRKSTIFGAPKIQRIFEGFLMPQTLSV